MGVARYVTDLLRENRVAIERYSFTEFPLILK